ncbi:putative LRR receptor-like serine/threonine-protein kinase [Hordeum vulgare]|nr:putative LRR receptor-like serine/threonine-protein kinase [Hordeum vulgare]
MDRSRQPEDNRICTGGYAARAGTFGFVTPSEYGEGSSASTLGDVYSLVILLYEMFTGRSPTDDMFRDSLDLHKFPEAAFPGRILEIPDPTMLVHDGANDRMQRDRIEECSIPVIGLGLSCSKQQPRERMAICDAAMEMHGMYILSGSLIVEHEGETETSALQ